MSLPHHLTSLIVFGWSIYYFYRKDYGRLKTKRNCVLTGIGLMFLAVLADIFFTSLAQDSLDCIFALLVSGIVVITIKLSKNKKLAKPHE